MYVFRPARPEDLPVIYKMQDIPFRDRVYANYLPRYENWKEQTERNIKKNYEQFYMFENDGQPEGFVQYLKGADAWNIIVWGRWLNTLIYLGLKTAYDDLGCPNVTSAVRQDNKRVIKAYQKFNIRKTGQEMMPYRQGSALGYITIAFFNYYEMTREEFEERRQLLSSQSMPVDILPPIPPVA